jgi:hypothetical protein
MHPAQFGTKQPRLLVEQGLQHADVALLDRNEDDPA